jgi:hypothetical protein
METKKEYCSSCRVKHFWCKSCRLRNLPNNHVMTDEDY